MKKIIIPALLLFMVSCGQKKETTAGDKKQDTTHVATAAVYQCPMDCEHGKTYDKPGQCPVCGMDLEIKT